LRVFFSAVVLSAVPYFFLLSLLIDPEDQWRGELEPDWTLWILFAVAAAALLGVRWARGRRLSGTTALALARSYTTRFFVGIGLADSSALLGVVIALAMSRLWPYLAGQAASLVGFAMMAPTARNIERDEERLRAEGSPVTVWDALTQPPDGCAPGTP
jgi:F0F1-type ATP synthase membrane subunit c/vacuolar-type H+-ATPase subunit K